MNPAAMRSSSSCHDAAIGLHAVMAPMDRGAVLRLDDRDPLSSAASILVGPLGAGSIIHTAFSLDRQLGLVHSGAARLFVNLLSAGPRASSAK